MRKILALLILASILLIGCSIGPELESKAMQFCSDKNIAAVYECGTYLRVVSTLTGRGSTVYRKDGTEINCPIVTPDLMSDECRELVLAPRCEEKRIC